ncbi:alpha-amylase family glycosyl hydrolase [Capilliphycus salinus ALCB114379]|uniref:alpha-amylase family glycosyl hydrolase n=1 Tax=Capilliphycus salinus TaxID=2768948 RepID=UPI0039A704A9
MNSPDYPTLYQVNTRVRLRQLSDQLNRPTTLDDILDTELDEWVNLGFNWIYLLGVWETGILGQNVSRTHPGWRREYEELLSDLQEDDICGSCFAITRYRVSELLGGNEALLRLKKRLQQRGLKLMVDFVPNHTAIDSPWVEEHPDYYIEATVDDLKREQLNYVQIPLAGENRVFAHGRDPYFPGWPDTLQLNYNNPAVPKAMLAELLQIAQLCDGVRCDMAMLILPEVFLQTWGMTTELFWPEAIEKVRNQHPYFVFMAEVYWDMEWTLQQQGFDFTYDKRLYDRLRDRQADPVLKHFWAEINYQSKLTRFLENHDEPRAAATFPPGVHQAAAILTYLCPGLRFFHEGQLQGFPKKISVHLQRGPQQLTDPTLASFYNRLLACLRLPVFHHGTWQMLEFQPASEDNFTCHNFIAFSWYGENKWLLIVVNYSPDSAQGYLQIPFEDLQNKTYKLQDLMNSADYERQGNKLLSSGLYLDLPAWGYHVFDVK